MKTIFSLPLLLLCLCLPSLAAAQAGLTLLVKTDMSCNWKLDGEPMGLLVADNPRVVLVSPGEHLIDAVTTDGKATVRTKVQVDKVEKTVDIQLRGKNDQQSKMQQAETPRGPAVADAALNQTWTDPATGLMWTGKDNGSNVDWPEANAYCSDLKLAGHDGWRLPTIEELQGMDDPSVSSRIVFGNGVTYNVHIKGSIRLTGSQWSSSLGDGPGQPWQWAWFFNFGDPRRTNLAVEKPATTFITFNYSMRTLCVRRPENDVIDR